MNVLVINPILYTSETSQIKKVDSIKDTMIYDLCLAFCEQGHTVVLYADEEFKPMVAEAYPFEIKWGQSIIKKIFKPNCFPFMPGVRRYIKQERGHFDLIISSEIFSMNTLMAYMANKDKLLVWHELALHNKIFKRIPSIVWYNVIARFGMKDVKVVARSQEAKLFIKKYCKNTQDLIIEHGVNLDKFVPSKTKENRFIVCSQLIKRKNIDGIILIFEQFLKQNAEEYFLDIVGDGEQEAELKRLVHERKLGARVVFHGKKTHSELLPMLSKAKALLVNTEKDNSMISIIESIAVGTPVVTTDVPLNASYIKASELGIAKAVWNAFDLQKIVKEQAFYIANCLRYREQLATESKVEQFCRSHKQF